jgi:uncharacterized transporter YbjL
MSIQRQIFLALALFVLVGLALGVWVSPWWLLLPAGVGLGMLSAAIIGTCTMTRVLGAMPWNETHSGDIS